MKTYARYKDSGISWIGRIPEHWDTRRLKNTVTLICEKTSELSLPYVGLENIVSWTGNLIKGCYEPDADANKFEKGDVLFSKLRPYLAKCFTANFQGKCSSELLVLRNFQGERDYLKNILLSFGFVDLVNASTYGTKMPRANWGFIGNCIIPLPPLEEQKSIAVYLDKKTEQINDLVAAKQKQIELLKEYKQSLIANAVTKGINSKAKMKDSGISWIGKVPEHWEIDKLGHRFIQRKEKVSDKDFEPLSVSKMGVTPQLESACKSDDGDNRKLVRKGDFVVNSRSDRKGSCGFSELDGSVSLINIVVTPRCDNGWYYHHLFRSNNYIEEFYRMGRGIVADLWTTRWSEMRTIMIPVPPIDEQKQIVAYINERVSSIDTQISSIEKQIANLNEYKQSLISDVVTGKVKV